MTALLTCLLFAGIGFVAGARYGARRGYAAGRAVAVRDQSRRQPVVVDLMAGQYWHNAN